MRILLGTGAVALALSLGAAGRYLTTACCRPAAPAQAVVVEKEAAPAPAVPQARPADIVHRPAAPVPAAPEVLEPIIVEGAAPRMAAAADDAATDVGPGVAASALTPQPPRPDVEPGREARMPYAE